MTVVVDIEQLAEAVAERVEKRLAARAARRYLSIAEYAQTTGLNQRTVHRAIAEGRLTTERAGRRVLIPCDARIQARCPH